MDRRRLWIVSGLFGLVLPLLVPAIGSTGAQDKEDKDDGGLVEFRKDHPLGQVVPDKALVYFVRPTSMAFAIKSWMFCDDDVLGANKGSSYFFAHVEPGKHVFWSKSENVDALELEVEAGRTYYVQQHMRMGGMKAHTKLEVLAEADGVERLAKCAKHGVLTDKGLERGAEIAAAYKGRTVEDLARRAGEGQKQGE
jgi:hypothetical protein